MTKFVTPHTDEWFAALERMNPRQAVQTRQIIQLAGSREVCSVCGDLPANDYHITNAPVKDKAFATIRLCETCLSIRQSMYGEKFVKLSQVQQGEK